MEFKNGTVQKILNKIFGGPEEVFTRYHCIFFNQVIYDQFKQALGTGSSIIYAYKLVTFTSGDRRLIKPDGRDAFRPEFHISTVGDSHHSLITHFGDVIPSKTVFVYSFVSIHQIKGPTLAFDHPATDINIVRKCLGTYLEASMLKTAKDALKYASIASFAVGLMPGVDIITVAAYRSTITSAIRNLLNYDPQDSPGPLHYQPVATQEWNTGALNSVEAAPSYEIGSDDEDDGWDDSPRSESSIQITVFVPDKLKKYLNNISKTAYQYLRQVNPERLKRNDVNIFFVIAGPHRGVVGILTADDNPNSPWLMLNRYDSIYISENGDRRLGNVNVYSKSNDPHHDFISSQIKVSKFQIVPIKYSVK